MQPSQVKAPKWKPEDGALHTLQGISPTFSFLTSLPVKEKKNHFLNHIHENSSSCQTFEKVVVVIYVICYTVQQIILKVIKFHNLTIKNI